MKGVAAAIFLAVSAGLGWLWWNAGGPGWYGIAVTALLGTKLLLSWLHRAETVRNAGEQSILDGLRVGAAIPMYNEDPQMLRASLASLLAQTRPVQSVVVVDDGSQDGASLQEARSWIPSFAERGIDLRVIEFAVNRGKREGLVACLDLQPDADLLLCVDSDTVLDERAVENAIVPFVNERVKVVTGLVLALNYRTNLLTRLTDLRYANAFLYERSAYSTLRSVLCACGSLAVYRTEVMRAYREDFLTQTFLGARAVFGDDRRLTNYGLLEGDALLQPTAVAYTAVPERLGHYARQQIRWNKSFFRESLWVLRSMSPRKTAFWLTAVELLTWLVFSIAIMLALVVAPLVHGSAPFLTYLALIALLAYARSIRYLDMQGTARSLPVRIGGFAMAPLYGLLHVFLLVWLRTFALVTLRHGRWGTRRGVEVTIPEEHRVDGAAGR
ncbi:glycosyltransferase [Leifsonia sp. NPDC056665]|uniref:glycosyltransferase n=1 Tax=Leifsonia sp. NPDC056665 TaxID=3345901 RepID=UPI00367935FF